MPGNKVFPGYDPAVPARYLLAPRAGKTCAGLMVRAAPDIKPSCTFTTASGSGKMKVVPYFGMSKATGMPSFAVSTKATTLKIDGTFTYPPEGANLTSFYINDGAVPVNVVCVGR